MDKSRGFKNIVFGILAQVVTIGFGILIPRLVIVSLGSEANGLLSSVGSAITYLSLLEAGVGTATIQALYKPIAEHDRESVSQVMSATHFFYRRTGYIYLILVVILAAAFSLLSRSSIPKYQVFLVVFISGLSGALSYFFQGKFRLILSAEGKGYVLTNLATITSVGISIFKVVVLLGGGDVVAVQTIYFVFNLFQMLFFAVYMHRHYDWINYHAKPDFEAISQKNAVLVHQVSGLIFNNTDIIILTAFCGFSEVSVYSMYAMIYGMVKSIAISMSDAFIYALGQSFHDRPRFLRLFDAYEVYNMAITASLFCICHNLIIPFLGIYTAGVNDVNYINRALPWLFSAYYLMHNGRVPSANVISIAQQFENTKWRSILESTINLAVSLLLTWRFGIYGVLWGTIAALLYRTNDMVIYAAGILERSPLITYKRWITNLFLFGAITFIFSQLEFDFANYIDLIILGSIFAVVSVTLFIGINSILEPKTSMFVFNHIHDYLHTKFGR